MLNDISVIGVGASAGGLEALIEFFSNVALTKKVSFVVAQHLAPKYRSMMVELLQKQTKLKVREVRDHQILRDGVVYIVPPNRDAIIKNGRIQLELPSNVIGPKPSIDRLFETMGESFGKSCMAVILSGTGSDGSRGIQNVKKMGGLTFSQKPESAKYRGMPVAAIETGSVDYILTPKEIAHFINGDTVEVQQKLPINKGILNEILQLVKEKTGNDFSGYKPVSLKRRLLRQMNMAGYSSFKAYLLHLKDHPAEVRALFENITVNVTAFFRDPEAFTALEKQILQVIKTKKDRSSFRIWVVGCSTGQEAYSLAILVRELEKQLRLSLDLTIFATDIDELALDRARKGTYSMKEVESIPAILLEKYFVKKGSFYIIQKSIRDIILFAKHNVIQDPPFGRLDLVACRNVLIYLDQKVQNDIFKIFHYSLNSNGLLFLGKSETVWQGGMELFELKVAKERIFARGALAKAVVPLKDRTGANGKPKSKSVKIDLPAEVVKQKPDALETDFLLSNLLPPAFLVDSTGKIHGLYGGYRTVLAEYRNPAGANLTDVVLPELKKDVKRFFDGKSATKVRKSGFEKVAYPFNKPYGRSDLFYLLYKPRLVEVPIKGSKKDQSQVREIELQLLKAQEQLQTVVQELETTNEELQSTNEELQSTNEELSSSNEELETANEELQSSNEELITLNDELSSKSHELVQTNLDLENILVALAMPVFVISKDGKLNRANSAARQLLPMFSLHPGAEFIEGNLPNEFHSIVATFRKVLASRETYADLICYNDCYYSVKINPFFQTMGRVEGVVVLFYDVSELTRAKMQLIDREERLLTLLRHSGTLVSLKDVTGKYLLVNEKFANILGRKVSDFVDHTDDEFFPDSLCESFKNCEIQVLRSRATFTKEEILPTEQGPVTYLANYFPLINNNNQIYGAGCIRSDITILRHSEQIIADQRNKLLLASKLSALGEMATGIAHELNTPLQVVIGQTELLGTLISNNMLDDSKLGESLEAIKSVSFTMGKIIRGLRTYARDGATDPFEVTSAKTIIEDAVQLCAARIKQSQVHIELPNFSKDMRFNCRATQIIQLLINLINNSVDAIEAQKDPWIRISCDYDGKYIEICITDSGRGLAPDVLERLGQPFFTTKEVGKGTGLGMSISRSIAEAHGGSINYDSTSENTRFVIRLLK